MFLLKVLDESLPWKKGHQFPAAWKQKAGSQTWEVRKRPPSLGAYETWLGTASHWSPCSSCQLLMPVRVCLTHSRGEGVGAEQGVSSWQAERMMFPFNTSKRGRRNKMQTIGFIQRSLIAMVEAWASQVGILFFVTEERILIQSHVGLILKSGLPRRWLGFTSYFSY